MTNRIASDPDWLREAFASPGATIRSVAEAAGCDEKTVRRWQKRHGVASRPVEETASRRQAESGALPASTREVLVGELLGDGNLAARNRRPGAKVHAARYRHNTKSREHLQLLADRFQGLTCTITGPAPTSFGGTRYSLSTRSHAALGPIYAAWYDESLPPHHRKIVPADIEITPTVALHWYLGDGYLQESVERAPTSALCVCNFRPAEVELLADGLRAFRSRIARKGPYPMIWVDAMSFTEWIGPCPLPDVYGHKWPKGLFVRRVNRFTFRRAAQPA